MNAGITRITFRVKTLVRTKDILRLGKTRVFVFFMSICLTAVTPFIDRCRRSRMFKPTCNDIKYFESFFDLLDFPAGVESSRYARIFKRFGNTSEYLV